MERPQGSLPSNTETKLWEHVKLITLRSGLNLEERLPTEKSIEIPQKKPKDKIENKDKEVVATPPTFTLRITYPAHLKKDQTNEQNKKDLDLFK